MAAVLQRQPPVSLTFWLSPPAIVPSTLNLDWPALLLSYGIQREEGSVGSSPAFEKTGSFCFLLLEMLTPGREPGDTV